MPMFRVAKPKGHAQLSADVSLAAGQQTVPLDELLWSEGDAGWASGPGFAPGRPGLYLVSGSIGRAAVASTSGLQVGVRVNGLAPQQFGTIITPSTTSAITSQIVLFAELDAGDVVTLVGTLHGSISATCRRIGTGLSVVRVGPERWTG